MHVEIKDNQIVIKISEVESNFLTQKALQAGQKDVCSYIKAQLLETLGLQNFEGRAMLQQSGGFDLTIIKQASAHLNKFQPLTPVDFRPGESTKSKIDDHNFLVEESPIIESAHVEIEDTPEIERAEVELEESPEPINVKPEGDLLDDLLDKDLLEGRMPVRDNVTAETDTNSEADLNKSSDRAKRGKPDSPSGEPKAGNAAQNRVKTLNSVGLVGIPP